MLAFLHVCSGYFVFFQTACDGSCSVYSVDVIVNWDITNNIYSKRGVFVSSIHAIHYSE